MNIRGVATVVVFWGLLSVCSVNAEIVTGNLLTNPGAESGSGTDPGKVSGWAVGGSSNPGRDNGTFDGFTPHSGSYDFYGNHGTNGTLTQTVDLLSTSLTPAELDAGATANFDFFEQSLDQGSAGDTAGVNLAFLDDKGSVLGTATSGEIYHPGGWVKVTGSAHLPFGTRSINYQMFFTLHVGSDLDSFIDENQLTISYGNVDALPVASLAATIPSVTVGSGDIGEFTVSLSAPQTSELVVNYEIRGSAKNGTDYELLSGKVKFKPGKTSKPIKIVPKGDLEGVADKVVKLILIPGSGYTIGPTKPAKVKILGRE